MLGRGSKVVESRRQLRLRMSSSSPIYAADTRLPCLPRHPCISAVGFQVGICRLMDSFSSSSEQWTPEGRAFDASGKYAKKSRKNAAQEDTAHFCSNAAEAGPAAAAAAAKTQNADMSSRQINLPRSASQAAPVCDPQASGPRWGFIKQAKAQAPSAGQLSAGATDEIIPRTPAGAVPQDPPSESDLQLPASNGSSLKLGFQSKWACSGHFASGPARAACRAAC